MPAKKNKITRKVLKINQEALRKHLNVIRTHGLNLQGCAKAIEIGRDIFYWQKGRERFELTDEEVSRLLFK